MTTKRLRVSSLLWVATLVLAPGCSLPRGVTGALDTGAGPIDAFVSGLDSGPPIDTGVEMPDAYAPPIDSGTDAYAPPVDAYVPPVDAYVPPVDAYVAPVDAYVPPAGDASSPCDIAYGAVSGYAPCGGTSTTTCVFYANWSGSSSHDCNSVCGARCVSAIGNVDGTMCSTSGGSFPCDQSFQDAICTCTP